MIYGHRCQICKKKWRKGTRRLDVHHRLVKECGANSRGYDRVVSLKEIKRRFVALCHFDHLSLEPVRKKMSLGSSHSSGKVGGNEKWKALGDVSAGKLVIYGGLTK